MNSSKEKTELEVKDFGPIAEANLELCPLTIFVGPSNSGKTYLAYLIYALHQFFGGAGLYARSGKSRPHTFRVDQKLNQKGIEMASSILQGLDKKGKNSIDSRVKVSFPKEFSRFIKKYQTERKYQFGDAIQECFGQNGSEEMLIRRGQESTGSRIVLKRLSEENKTVFEQQFKIHHDDVSTSVKLLNEIPLAVGADDAHYFQQIVDHYNSPEQFTFVNVLSVVDNLLIPSLVNPMHMPAYYLPADRTGIMHSHSAVSETQVDRDYNAAKSTEQERVSPLFSGVLSDFIKHLIKLNPKNIRLIKHRRDAADLGTNIEEEILEGTIKVTGVTGYPEFRYTPAGWKGENNSLSMMHASSMVSELAPVVLYLRYYVSPNNVLIVEEPEAHLHPEMQIKLAQQLAVLVSKGVRVIVTTHSEWLMEAFANIVERSKTGSRNDGSEVSLNSRDVGAWLFTTKRGPKRSIVQRINIDETSGLYPTDFERVAITLHNEWADITSEIESNR